ncbi:MAG: ribosome maturation factor RimM [Candidatus Limnocylindrales bacterium]
MSDTPPAAGTRLVVAQVRGLHGLAGIVRVEVLTDRPEDRFVAGRVLHREGTEAPLTIDSAAAVNDGPGWRLRFREVRDRDAAEALRDAYLETVVDRAADLEPGAAYWHEVIGTEVRGGDGRVLGTVRDIYRVGEAEVLVVGGGPVPEFDVPNVRALVTTFAPDRGEIVVDEAALDLGSEPVDSPVVGPPRRRPRWSKHGKGGGAPGEGTPPSEGTPPTVGTSPDEGTPPTEGTPPDEGTPPTGS